MATDSPDWQEVVTLVSGGSVPDAPDWQRTVTGPGATPPVAGGATFPDFVPNGTVARTQPMVALGGSVGPGVGQIMGMACTPIVSGTVSKVGAFLNTAGGGAVTAECGVAIYSASLTSLTIDLLAAGYGATFAGFTPPSTYFVDLSSSPNVTAGSVYYLAVLFNGSSGPSYVTGYETTGTAGTVPAEGVYLYTFFTTKLQTYTAFPASIDFATDINANTFSPMLYLV